MSSNPIAGKFLPAQIAALKPTGKSYDVPDPAVPNLLLRVGPTGTKRWLFRFRWMGKQPRIAIGNYPDVGVAVARERAIAHQNQIKGGIDPRNARRDAVTQAAARTQPPASRPSTSGGSVLTPPFLPSTQDDPLTISKPDDPADKHSVHFLAYEYVELYVKRRREGSKEVIRILKKDVLPYWRNRDARTITSREIIERLDGIVAREAPVMANRTAQILGQMFTFGIHRSIVPNSPVNLLFPPGGAEKACDRVLSEEELHRFLHGLVAVVQTEVRRRTLMVLLLTGIRRGSLAQAEWKEIDFDAGEWSVPAEHDKERRAHIVLLSSWTVEELLALKRLSVGSHYVLPKCRKNDVDQASNAQLISRSVARLRERFQVIGVQPFTPHDIRRTVRTHLAALGVVEDIAERVLNHSRGELVNTFDPHKYVPEKRVALERWETRLQSTLGSPPPNPRAEELIRQWLRTRWKVNPRSPAVPAVGELRSSPKSNGSE